MKHKKSRSKPENTGKAKADLWVLVITDKKFPFRAITSLNTKEGSVWAWAPEKAQKIANHNKCNFLQNGLHK